MYSKVHSTHLEEYYGNRPYKRNLGAINISGNSLSLSFHPPLWWFTLYQSSPCPPLWTPPPWDQLTWTPAASPCWPPRSPCRLWPPCRRRGRCAASGRRTWRPKEEEINNIFYLVELRMGIIYAMCQSKFNGTDLIRFVRIQEGLNMTELIKLDRF